MNKTELREAWVAEARELGRKHGRNAGAWAADGNTTQEHIRGVLAMFEDGDPQAFDYLPRMPNLSGEFADDLTPQRLYYEVTGASDDYEADESTEALCDAYEEGVAETFEASCEETLRGFLSDES